MSNARSRGLLWTAVAGVVACALTTGWLVYGVVARPSPAVPLQASVSPTGQWQVRTWFVGEEVLGRPAGVLRVDVVDVVAVRPGTRTIYVDPVTTRDAARRLLLWRDADHLALSLVDGGVVVLDVAHAPPQGTPGAFATVVKATAVATACLLLVLAGGVLAVLLVRSWLIRRDEARWEDWPVAEGRRHAPHG